MRASNGRAAKSFQTYAYLSESSGQPAGPDRFGLVAEPALAGASLTFVRPYQGDQGDQGVWRQPGSAEARAEACPVGRVPAAEIEAAVIDQLRGIFRQPEIIVGTWRAAREEATDVSEAEVREALLQLDPLWDELFPAEQARGPRSTSVTSRDRGAHKRHANDSDCVVVLAVQSEPVSGFPCFRPITGKIAKSMA